MSTSRLQLRWLIVPAAALFVLPSCGSDGPTTPATGTIEATATTTGEDIDPDGYTVTVNGSNNQSLTVNGTSTISNVSEGAATVELTGVADNCTVAGDNPRTVQVTGGETATTTFDVTCVAREGSVEVTTSSTGDDLDGDGYTVELDGTSIGTIGINETKTFSGIDEGTYTLSLSGVAANCTVASNDQSVTVNFDGTATVTFDVDCSSTTGDLDVTTSTTGQDLDPDGYTVTVDPGTANEESQSIGLDATVTFASRTTGDHVVELSGVADNCTVSGDNPRTVNVPEGGAATTFDVSCVNREGDLEVTASTTGDNQDPDGYTITVDAGTADEVIQNVSINGTVTFSALDEGDHTVELSGNASNCQVAGDNPRNVTVPFNGTVSTTFELSCWVPLDDQIVFESDRDDPGGNFSIYVMNPDGSGLKRLTDPAHDDRNPHVSPDGTKILFQSGRGGSGPDVYIMNPDGSGVFNATDGFGGYNPQWSPLGDKFAWTRPLSGNAEVWVKDNVNDPAQRRQLTNSPGFDDLPTWSPDGQTIAFTSVRCNGTCVSPDSLDIWVVPEDGSSAPTQITTSAGLDGNATWVEQGDGTNLIAFTSARDGVEEIYRIEVDADGTNPRNEMNLTQNGSNDDGFPSWKPDGTALAFFSNRDGNDEIYTMNADGSNQTRRTNNAAEDQAPAWSENIP